MTFTTTFFLDALDIPPAKVPINITTLISYVIPPVACYFVFAILTLTPRTRLVRVALWPAVALLAFRAIVSVDMSRGKPGQLFLNTDLMLAMLSITLHTLSWSSTEKPLVRNIRPANSSPSVIMDALDLITNLRGYGWDWSRGLYVPRDTRPTNRHTFILYAALSGIAHTLITGTLYRAIHAFATASGSSSEMFTIFDESLLAYVRYLRSSIISTMAAFGIYSVIQAGYDLTTVLGVLVFGQDPAQWPPIFDSPWRAKSLGEFWARRWHQFMRHIFLLGAYPFSVVFGRPGTVIGAFISSAVFHHFTMITFNPRSEMWYMLVGFGMMGPGILIERAFYKLTGIKVGGVAGWAWTMGWLILWGNVMVDGFARAGMFLSTSPIDNQLPMRDLVDKLVIGLDTWLHTF